MRNAYVRSFLAIIVLLQSFAVVADAHQFHQSNNQHEIIAEYIYEPAAFIVADDVDQQDDALDRHHCCHCHSLGCSVLPVSPCHIGLINSPSVTFMYTDRYSFQPSGSLYRPPIV